MQTTRRSFLLSSAATLAFGKKTLSGKERIDKVLKGEMADRPPYTAWYHFGLEKEGPERHAQATINFHRRFQTDIVKVMSDFPYPKPAGKWYEAREIPNPFPPQIRALEMIRDAVSKDAYFVETVFNPWNVAEKLSSKEEVLRLKNEEPQRLLDALDAIARSEANHARQAIEAGASGIFLAIANAQEGILSEADYGKFSEPFDRMVLAAVRGARLNTLHLHGDKVYLQRFLKGWPAEVINYSEAATKVPIEFVRKQYSGTLMGGIDEVKFRKLSKNDLRKEFETAVKAAGPRLIVAPGCSVPNDSKDTEVAALRDVIAR